MEQASYRQKKIITSHFSFDLRVYNLSILQTGKTWHFRREINEVLPRG